ncbi:MAG: malonate decarboxylase subunit alpha [Oscillibacter sp.]|nr:malonate decarboxylase subunit alpha [Oscillibacter sp.]MEA4994592.1 malonate decarboxylase subunit alpha [Oscillibacter sp.]
MLNEKFVSAEQAAGAIPDGAYVGIGGFLGIGSAEEINVAIETRFLVEGHPRDLTLLHTGGVGDGKDAGNNHLAHEGLVKRLIGGHFARIPKLGAMVEQEKIEAFNIPQGILSHLYRESAAMRPRLITKVGLGTFVDPDLDGAKVNGITTGTMVDKVQIDGEAYLSYHVPPVTVAMIRGTTADEQGNISFENEPLTLEGISIATAAKNHGGIVIVQVEKVVKKGAILPQNVKIPHILVDYIVVTTKPEEYHRQNYGTYFDPRFTRSDIVVGGTAVRAQMGVRKIIGRRAAMCLDRKMRVVNFGIGIPETVMAVLNEEGQSVGFTSIIESGAIGGIALGDMNFGSCICPDAIIDQPYMFDFIDGGGLDMSFLGLAQCDARGNINVSRFGTKVTGCGGFIDISQNVKNMVFCGTFTAKGLETRISDAGELVIEKEGSSKKFIKTLQQITFSGEIAAKNKRNILFITERAVLKLTPEGLMVTEIAPGIDLERDVLGQMEFTPLLAADLKTMDPRIFREEAMGLTF